MCRKYWILNYAMPNLLLSNKILSQVKTAYRINFTHGNGKVDVKINNI